MMNGSDSDLPRSLPAPARRALGQEGYTRIEQFMERTEADTRQLHGMGHRVVEQIRLGLAAKGLSFSN